MMTIPQIPMDILLIEDRAEDIGHVEEAVTATKLENRMIVAKTPVEALLYLKHCAPPGPCQREEDREKERPPGLILLDVDMENHCALDVLHDLRTNQVLMTIPIVILTENLAESDLACTMNHGVTGYFLKPMDAAQLRRIVKDVEEHWSLLATPPCAN